MAPTVSIIANPASARDIRRVVANATGLQIADRANIVLRVLAALASCGIEQVLMMTETGGIRGHVVRGIERSRNQRESRYPVVTFLDIPVTGTVEDTKLAARLMRSAEVACVVVLGGDGTHRAVVSECGSDTVIESVESTGRLLVVDEANPRCSIATDIAAHVAQHAFGALKAAPQMVTAPHTPVPFSPVLEDLYIPTSDAIAAAVSKTLDRAVAR